MNNLVPMNPVSGLPAENYCDPRLQWELRPGSPRVLYGETAIATLDMARIAAAAGVVGVDFAGQVDGLARWVGLIPEHNLRVELARREPQPGEAIVAPRPVFHTERIDVLGGKLTTAEHDEAAERRRARARRRLELSAQGYVYVGSSARRHTHLDGRYTEHATDFYRFDWDALAFAHIQAHLERRADQAAAEGGQILSTHRPAVEAITAALVSEERVPGREFLRLIQDSPTIG